MKYTLINRLISRPSHVQYIALADSGIDAMSLGRVAPLTRGNYTGQQRLGSSVRAARWRLWRGDQRSCLLHGLSGPLPVTPIHVTAAVRSGRPHPAVPPLRGPVGFPQQLRRRPVGSGVGPPRRPRSRRHPRRPASRRQGQGGAPVGGWGRAARGAPRARVGGRGPRLAATAPLARVSARRASRPPVGCRPCDGREDHSATPPTPPGGAGGELAAAPHHRPCGAGGADAVRGLDGVWLGLCFGRAPFAVPRLAAGRVAAPPPPRALPSVAPSCWTRGDSFPSTDFRCAARLPCTPSPPPPLTPVSARPLSFRFPRCVAPSWVPLFPPLRLSPVPSRSVLAAAPPWPRVVLLAAATHATSPR